MVRAYVLLNANLGKEDAVVQMLSEIPEVKEVFKVYGVYDLIVLVEADSMPDLGRIVTGKLRWAFSDKSRQDSAHIRGCRVCGRFFNNTLEFGSLTGRDAGHLFRFLQRHFLVHDPLRSTLTLPVVEGGSTGFQKTKRKSFWS